MTIEARFRLKRAKRTTHRVRFKSPLESYLEKHPVFYQKQHKHYSIVAGRQYRAIKIDLAKDGILVSHQQIGSKHYLNLYDKTSVSLFEKKYPSIALRGHKSSLKRSYRKKVAGAGIEPAAFEV